MSRVPAPPFLNVTANNESAYVSIPNCILIVFSSLVVISRAFARLRITSLTKSDDLATVFALAFAIAQTVCTQLAVTHGLGARDQHGSQHEFIAYSKAQILAIVAIAFAKFAVSRLIIAIKPTQLVSLLCYGLERLVGLWAFTSILVLAFQCHLLHPYLLGSGRSLSLYAVYNYVGIMNIITDTALVFIPTPLVCGIQMRLAAKILVIGLFGSRIIVPVATIVQLIYLQRYLTRLDRDQRWENTKPAHLLQIVMNVRIITTCVPSLRRVVTNLHTDLIGLKVSENMEFSMARTTGCGTSHSKGSVPDPYSHFDSTPKETSESGRSSSMETKGDLGTMTSMFYSGSWSEVDHGQSSEEHLKDNAVTCTVRYGVEEDD